MTRLVRFEYESCPFVFEFADTGSGFEAIDMRVGDHSVGHLWDGPFPQQMEQMAREQLERELRAERRQQQEDQAAERADAWRTYGELLAEAA